jgi:choline dehydrogenase-like flavoprotein
VVVARAGHEEAYAGDIVVVCAGAANTARILLRSAADRHPQGLANGSGQVGRNYMFHNSRAVLALSREPNETVYQKTLGVNDFYLASGGRQWPLGNIQMLGKSSAEAMKGEEPELTRLAPKLGLAQVARHGVDFWLTTEDVPRPDNRVTVDRDGNIHLAYTQTNDSEADGLYRELRTLLDHAGMPAHHVFDRSCFASMNISLAGCAHQAGTCRFGDDPATSVLDRDCKAHELDNLYVADASVMPSIGAVNPALTVMANALRVGDHLRQRLA